MKDAMTKRQSGKILVVDDISANLQLLTNLLTEQGYTVYPASDGELALEFLRATLPDLILLDIRMPGMDGYEVCRRLKADERTRDVPVIFISVLEDARDKVQGFRAGGVDYITKPFQPEEVLARIETHLWLRELTARLEQKVSERTGELTIANQRLQEEIAEHRRDEEEIRQNLAQQKSILDVYQNMETAPVRDITAFIADRCVNLTGSAIGFVGLISDDDQYMEAHIWSGKTMEKCPLNKPLRFPLSEAGLWAEPVRQRRLITVNDYRAPNPHKKGYPEGHLELSRFMGVPVIDQGRVVAVAGVANSGEDYAESDQYKVSLLLEWMWDLLKRKQAEEALRKSEERYRLVFENSPVSIWEEDFSAVKTFFDNLKQDGISDIKTYFDLHPEAIRHCAEQVRIVDVNRAALALHGARGKDELFAGLVNTFTVESFDTFRLELVRLWNGDAGMIEDAMIKTLAGEVRHVIVYFSVCPGHEETLSRVIVSLVDVSEKKRVEEELRRLNDELEQRVRKRTIELEMNNMELERINKLFVGRELKMVELKEKIKKLEGMCLQPDDGADASGRT